MGILKDVSEENQKKDLDLERIYIDRPDFYGQEMIDRHIKRYEWALNHLRVEDNVLDLCCGSGYGSKMIAKKCQNVLGLDKSDDAIAYAEKNYKKDNLDFVKGDLTNINFLFEITKLRFNTISWIEGVEHFTAEQAEMILKTCRFMVHGGRFIVSTPDKEQSDGKNEFHIKEYTAYELKSLINKYFKVIDIEIKDKFIYLVAEQNG